MRRRVVVSGIGLVTPLGCGAESVWARVLAGHVGVRRCTKVDEDLLAALPSHVAAEVEAGTGPGQFDIERWVPDRAVRKQVTLVRSPASRSDRRSTRPGFLADQRQNHAPPCTTLLPCPMARRHGRSCTMRWPRRSRRWQTPGGVQPSRTARSWSGRGFRSGSEWSTSRR